MRLLRIYLFAMSGALPAAAGERAENPAFCFGFLAAQAQGNARALSPGVSGIRELHARVGPKDSTDERGFADWEKIGRRAAADDRDERYGVLLDACTRLLEERRR